MDRRTFLGLTVAAVAIPDAAGAAPSDAFRWEPNPRIALEDMIGVLIAKANCERISDESFQDFVEYLLYPAGSPKLSAEETRAVRRSVRNNGMAPIRFDNEYPVSSAMVHFFQRPQYFNMTSELEFTRIGGRWYLETVDLRTQADYA